MKTNLIYILGMMCLSGTVSAQTTVNYTEFEQKVLDYSQTLKQSVSQRTAMQKAMKAAKTAFFPAVDATGSYQYRINKYDMDFKRAKETVDNLTEKVEYFEGKNHEKVYYIYRSNRYGSSNDDRMRKR